jgi:integrase
MPETRFQRLLKTAGLPHLRFHDLRHGLASLRLAQGTHPRVMETLGHSNIQTTMNVTATWYQRFYVKQPIASAPCLRV